MRRTKPNRFRAGTFKKTLVLVRASLVFEDPTGTCTTGMSCAFPVSTIEGYKRCITCCRKGLKINELDKTFVGDFFITFGVCASVCARGHMRMCVSKGDGKGRKVCIHEQRLQRIALVLRT